MSSASQKYGPSARDMKRGVPPTDRKARTGELTPPGVVICARIKSVLFLEGVMEGMTQSGKGKVKKYMSGRLVICVRFAGPEIAVRYELSHAEPLRIGNCRHGKFLCFKH